TTREFWNTARSHGACLDFSVLANLAVAINSISFGDKILMSNFYQYQIIAKTGDEGIEDLGNRTSINDEGVVAFTGDLDDSVFGGNAVFVGDGSSLTDIAPASVLSSRRFGTAIQINNAGQVVAAWTQSNGISAIRLFESNSINTFETIATGGGSQSGFNYPFDYFSILPLTSVNNSGESVFPVFDEEFSFDPIVGASFGLGDDLLVTAPKPPTDDFNTLSLPVNPVTLRPMIADNGNVIVKLGNEDNSPIILYDNDFNDAEGIAGSSQYSEIGRSPGISDDGQIVVFAGDRGNGSGIFASIDTGSRRELITIAGENSSRNPLQLGYGDLNTQTRDIPVIQFESFDINSRIGVSHVESGRTGILDDTFVVSFIGTPNQASRNNPITAKSLLFSDQKALWTVKVTVDSKLDGSEGFDFNQTSAIPVVQVDDVINGATVNDISVYDPIANVGITNSSPDSHQIAFFANTDDGEMIIKAEHLDTDGDGLLDHWEEKGIDIDRDGIIDLDLKAMGADKNKKDLFLEIDWLAPDAATSRDFSPQAQALDFVVDVFKDQDITVHIDAGTGLSRNMGSGSLEGGDLIREAGTRNHIDLVYFDENFPASGAEDKNGDGFAVSRSFENIKDNFFGTTTKRARELAFRYAVFADYSDLNGSSGIAELQEIDPDSGDFRSIPGNDLIVSLQGLRNVTDFIGSFPESIAIPAGFLQGQTLIHELGHTLGLRHGGKDNKTTPPIFLEGDTTIAAEKSSYKSVMNYLYQLYPDTFTTTPTLIRDYSDGSPFDDWRNIKLGFADYFTTLGNSYGIFSLAGTTANSTEEELTIDDIEQIFGPDALDNQVPVITTISAPANIRIGNFIDIDVTATDNIDIQSVGISFDINGDGDVDDSGETVTATQVSADQYQATFTNITGTAGSRTATITATDLANFTTIGTATVNVNSESINTSPQAVNDLATTNEDTAVEIDVLANDTDADGNPLTPSIAETPSNGSATINDNGTPTDPTDDTITYTPNVNFNGNDSFTYTVSDGTDTTNATVDITVNPVNDLPVATDDTAETNQDQPLTILSSQLLENDSDVDGDSLTITEVDNSTNGSVELDTDGNVLFTPEPNFSGLASFEYTVSDGTDTTNATVDITVNPSNDDNIINGTAGRDSLLGTDGNDIITGFQGADRITTGGGQDQIVYTSIVDAGDAIADFDALNDVLDLKGVLQSVGFNGSNAIDDGYVQLVSYGTRGTSLQIDADGIDGSAAFRPYLFLQDVSVAELNENPDSLIFG
ncbi:hypothetical protein BC008_28350, partial [Mastigocoleus testarum BC008]